MNVLHMVGRTSATSKSRLLGTHVHTYVTQLTYLQLYEYV